jgi:transcriptional regulator with XRE-family HTH domain
MFIFLGVFWGGHGDMTAGERVVRVAKAKKIKLKDIAEKIGLTPTAISLWGKEKRNIPSKYLRDVSEILGVSESFLLNGEGESSIYNIEDSGPRPSLQKNKEITLGGRVNIYREAHKISYGELAKTCRFVNTEQIKQVENNELQPTQQQITLLAKALGVSEAYLVDGPRYKDTQERMQDYSEKVISGEIKTTKFYARNMGVIGLSFKLISQYHVDGEILNELKAIDNELKEKDAQIVALQQKVIDCQNELIKANKEGRAKESTTAMGNTTIINTKKEMAEK